MKTIFVKDFSIATGSRYIQDGAYSGEEFRINILRPEFVKIMDTDEKLGIDLDGTIGYSYCWLDEVFGGLSREFGYARVLDRIKFISTEEEYLIHNIENIIV